VKKRETGGEELGTSYRLPLLVSVRQRGKLTYITDGLALLLLLLNIVQELLAAVVASVNVRTEMRTIAVLDGYMVQITASTVCKLGMYRHVCCSTL